MDHDTTAHAGIEGNTSPFRECHQHHDASGIALPRHEEALARLEYVASRQRGFALLTGPAGSGKSALLREFADRLRRETALTVYLDAHCCGEAELLRECCDELGLGCPGNWSTDRLRSTLLEAVRGRCAVGTRVVLILDHADRDDAESVRLIERLLHATHDLVGPTLVAACREGASPLLAALARDHADIRIQLSPLTVDETGDLIEALCGPGRQYAALTPEAVGAMHEVADGELRQVNRLWRLLQTAAMVEEANTIDTLMVDAVACELPE